MRRKFDQPFCGWDGEGVTVDGEHRYVFLANSRGESIENHAGIGTEAALAFFLRAAATPAIHVAFVHSYDVNMLLRDLPLHDLFTLFFGRKGRDGKTHRLIVWRGYKIKYLPRKLLYVSKGGATFTLWDVYGFFQSTFVKAVELYGDPAEIEQIRAMKARRSQFTLAEMSEIRSYCLAELRALVGISERLRQRLRAAGLILSRWDGAGAIAATLFRRHHVKDHLVHTPEHLRHATAAAYSGGRIEAAQIGFCGSAYVDDISSAYPAAMLDLPSLHGEWARVCCVYHPFALFEIEWLLPGGHIWYPLFYRTSQGAILYPPAGKGWYWKPELDLLLAWIKRFGGELRIHDSWCLRPHSDARPFGFLADAYAMRQELKAAGDPTEKIVKWGINSSYGKLASQLGADDEEQPPYFQLAWAGYVTSSVRAKMGMRALTLDPASILMFATDALFVAGSGPPIDARPQLGAWTRRAMANLVMLQSGIYWHFENGWRSRSRGFNREEMADPTFVFRAWMDRRRDVDVPATRFVTLGSALLSQERFATWRTWETQNRSLAIDGNSSKRAPLLIHQIPDLRMRTLPLQVRRAYDWELLGTPSAAYPVRFWPIPAALELPAEQKEDDADNDDAQWT